MEYPYLLQFCRYRVPDDLTVPAGIPPPMGVSNLLTLTRNLYLGHSKEAIGRAAKRMSPPICSVQSRVTAAVVIDPQVVTNSVHSQIYYRTFMSDAPESIFRWILFANELKFGDT